MKSKGSLNIQLDKKNSISQEDLKYLAKPLGIFLLVVFILIFSSIFGYNKIVDVNKRLKNAKRQKTVLGQNVAILSEVDEEVTNQNFIEVALPSDHAAVYFISQARRVAYENSLVISNIKTGISVKQGNGLLKASVSFDVEGSADGATQFLDQIVMSLPLTKIDKVKTTLAGGTARSSITVNVFSAELPEKIPSINTAIKSLTNEEKETLIELVDYQLPLFIKPEASEPTQRDNPFQ